MTEAGITASTHTMTRNKRGNRRSHQHRHHNVQPSYCTIIYRDQEHTGSLNGLKCTTIYPRPYIVPKYESCNDEPYDQVGVPWGPKGTANLASAVDVPLPSFSLRCVFSKGLRDLSFPDHSIDHLVTSLTMRDLIREELKFLSRETVWKLIMCYWIHLQQVITLSFHAAMHVRICLMHRLGHVIHKDCKHKRTQGIPQSERTP